MVTFFGSTNNDDVMGSSGNDTIFGGGGSDTLFGGMGADSLGAGTDTTGAGSQTTDVTSIFGGQGADTIYSGAKGTEYLSGDNDNDVIFLNAGMTAATVVGGQGADSINASAVTSAKLVIYGDDLMGNAFGGNGNDTITGGASSETIFGGQGDDAITHGAAVAGTSSALFGQLGNDTISSAAIGGVTIYGGQGNDTLSETGAAGNAGDYHWIFGNLGNDSISTSGSAATVFGGQGNDTITATGAFNNQLHGDIGNDSIVAGTGLDTIYGGIGSDTMTSGTAGATTFYDFNGDTTSAHYTVTQQNGSNLDVYDTTNTDVILGFRSGTDHIALQGHAALVTSGAQVAGNYADYATVQGSFAAAYDYAYGNSSTGTISHFNTNQVYLTEHTATQTILFVNDTQHTTIVFNNAALTLQNNDVIAG